MRSSFWVCLVFACAWPAVAAEAPKEEPRPPMRQVVILQGATRPVDMTNRRGRIRTVVNENEKVAHVLEVSGGGPLHISAVSPGSTRITMTDENEKSEMIEVIVRPNRLVLSVGASQRLQMTTKRPIRTVLNENERVVRVQEIVGDPTSVLVTGLRPGRARITLTDADGQKEVQELGGPPPRP
jgi:hypothetical protein